MRIFVSLDENCALRIAFAWCGHDKLVQNVINFKTTRWWRNDTYEEEDFLERYRNTDATFLCEASTLFLGEDIDETNDSVIYSCKTDKGEIVVFDNT